jgi:2-dehydro-3-deoxygalactonokinase
MTAMPDELVAVDWGTTSLRAYLVRRGEVIDAAHSARGVSTLRPGEHDVALWELVGHWCDAPRVVAVAGMGGSSVGIVETGYVEVPAGPGEIARAAVRSTWRGGELIVLPGVSARAPGGTVDVMRGEEVEVIGAGISDGIVVSSGSHSKWIVVRGGVIIDFRTYLTGELMHASRTATLLSRSIGDAVADATNAAFADAVQAARSGGLLHDLFGVRTAGLFGADEQACADRLAGTLLGAEVVDALAWLADRGESVAGGVVVIGGAAQAAAHARALDVLGVGSDVRGQTVAAAGIWRVVRAEEPGT